MMCDVCKARPFTFKADTPIGVRSYCDVCGLVVCKKLGKKLRNDLKDRGARWEKDLSETNHVDGFRGEAGFAKLTGLVANFNKAPGPDNGKDFVIADDFIIDVKCHRTHRALMMPWDRMADGRAPNLATHYVAIEMPELDNLDVMLVKWCAAGQLHSSPVYDPPAMGCTIRSHAVAWEELREFSELLYRIKHGHWEPVQAPHEDEIFK